MRKILLLDDNPLVARVWAAQLEADAFSVCTCHEVERALNLIDSEAPDLVLVDSALPEAEGLDVCEQVARSRFTCKTPAVVLLSNVCSPAMMARVAAGAALDIWLKHELSPRELAERVHRVLGMDVPCDGLKSHASLGDALVQAGYVTAEELAQAQMLCHRENLELDEALHQVRAMPSSDLRYLRELIFKADYVDLGNYKIEDDALLRVPEDLALRYQAIPLRLRDGELELVMADPHDVEAIDFLSRLSGCRIRPFYAPLQEVQKAQLLYYGGKEILDEKPHAAPEATDRLMDGRTVDQILAERPVVELLDVALMRARELRASDLHVEPCESAVVLRMRIDGMLHEMYRLAPEHHRAVVARIKILSGMDIAESRLPQDGRFQMRVADDMIDYRVSTLPVADGEKVVIRVLDRAAVIADLQALGIEPGDLETYRGMVRRPHGMVLITGPTGSGKTTTLFATLNALKNSTINIVSIEDPIEYRLEGVNQVQVNARIGLTFANVLRTVLRQDPNIVLVGEIRDVETAELAVQASLTGHLVLGTLHTNDAPTGLIRLMDMGIPSYMVTSTVNGLVAQRLMRRICLECKAPWRPDEATATALPEALRGVALFRGAGCKACRQTGYRGRVAIYELLPVTHDVREWVMRVQSAEAVRRDSRIEGLRTLREAAMEKIRQGVSTVEEMWRVTLDADG